MHTYHSFPSYWYQLCCYFSDYLSLSLFLSIGTIWSMAPKRSKSLFIPGHLLLILPPLTFDSVMRRLVWTYQRAFLDEALIWNAKLFGRIFLTLTFLLSSIVAVRSPYMASQSLVLRDHTGVLLQYARIWLFCTSFYHSRSRYAHCSHSRSYIWGATHTEGSASWLPQLWSSWDCVQRWIHVSFMWDTIFLGWASKHPLLGHR